MWEYFVIFLLGVVFGIFIFTLLQRYGPQQNDPQNNELISKPTSPFSPNAPTWGFGGSICGFSENGEKLSEKDMALGNYVAGKVWEINQKYKGYL